MAGAAQERRRSGAAAAGSNRREATLYFDSWKDGAPLARLVAGLGDLLSTTGRSQSMARMSLADSLDALADNTGFHVFVLLDRFEEFLALAPDQGDGAVFVDELVEVLLRPGLPASFLFAVDEDARTRLERLGVRVPGFDDNSLRFSPIAGVPVLTQSPMAAVGLPPDRADGAAAGLADARGSSPSFARSIRPQPHRGPPPRVPIKADEVYAFIEATLQRTAKRRSDSDEALPEHQPDPAQASSAHGVLELGDHPSSTDSGLARVSKAQAGR